jgi:hypothetical protein
MENRLYPMRELLAHLLLEEGDAASALNEYEASMNNAPERVHGFFGAAKAAEAVDDNNKATACFRKLIRLARDADGPRRNPHASSRSRSLITVAARNERPLLLRQRGEQVEDEGVNVGAKLRDDERHSVDHQAMHVTGEPVELGHDHRATKLSRCFDSGSELRPAVDGVGALSRLVLLEGPGDGEALRLREGGDRVALPFEAEASAR